MHGYPKSVGGNLRTELDVASANEGNTRKFSSFWRIEAAQLRFTTCHAVSMFSSETGRSISSAKSFSLFSVLRSHVDSHRVPSRPWAVARQFRDPASFARLPSGLLAASRPQVLHLPTPSRRQWTSTLSSSFQIREQPLRCHLLTSGHPDRVMKHTSCFQLALPLVGRTADFNRRVSARWPGAHKKAPVHWTGAA